MQNERLVRKLIDDYWLDKLSAVAPARRKSTVKKIQGVRAAINSGSLTDLWSMTRDNPFGEFIFLLSAYTVLLNRYFSLADIMVCSADIDATTSARKEDHLLWYMTRTDTGTTVRSLVTDLRAEVERVVRHRNFDYPALAAGFAARNLSETDLLQYGFSYNRVSGHSNHLRQSPFRLVIHKDTERNLELELIYDAGLVDPQLASGFVTHFASLVTGIAATIDTPIPHINLLSPEELRTIRNFNQESRREPSHPTITGLFRSRVTENSSRLALKAGTNRYTYAQLDEKSDRLARYLRHEHGVKKGQLIALVTDRTEWVIIAMLAILKTGAAFVPIDPDQPAERQQDIISDAGIGLMLLESTNMFRFSWFTGDLVVTDIQSDLPMDSNPDASIHPEGHDAAYVIYTSGTTGKPKGVMVNHSSVANYTSWLTDDIGVGPADSSLVMASLAFDLGYTSVWGTLLAGGALHLVDESYGTVPDKLLQYLTEQQISFIKTTPSLFYMLTHVPLFRGEDVHLSLRLIVLGGEMLRKEDLALYAQRYPLTRFLNHYGPTESTIGCIFNRIEEGKATDPYSDLPVIGRPLRNCEVFILDDNGSPTPLGLEGEICIGGDGLARGYLNNPELTAARFAPHPFDTARRIYKTGDFGKWTADGKVVLHGRRDRQVKIRGYRVELNEIEKALSRHDAIQSAVVVPETGAGGHIRLLAYYVATGELEETQLKEYLAQRLPEYMIPGLFVPIAALPLTANGKIDTRALPRPDRLVRRAAADDTPPANQVEALILGVWQEVLGKKNIGVRDNFFDVGGNSLLLVQVSSMLGDTFPGLTIVDMFNHTTVQKLARFVTEREHDTPRPIAGKPILFPEEYFSFNDGDDKLETTDLQFQLEVPILTELMAVAGWQGLSLPDIATAIFAYTIAGVSGQDLITIYTVQHQDGLLHLYPLELDFTTINEPAQLFRTFLSQRSTVSPVATVASDQGRTIQFKDKTPASITALVGAKEGLRGMTPVTGGFDLILAIDDEDGQGLSGILEYAPRLNPSLMETLLHHYVNHFSSLAAITV